MFRLKMTSRLGTQIFAIQEERAKEHARMERAFEQFGNQSEIEKYRVELDSISKGMRKLAEQTATLRKELTAAGKDELASIVFDLQKQEEELLLISAAYQVSRSQKNEDEADLKDTRRRVRNSIAELLQDYRAELD